MTARRPDASTISLSRTLGRKSIRMNCLVVILLLASLMSGIVSGKRRKGSHRQVELEGNNLVREGMDGIPAPPRFKDEASRVYLEVGVAFNQNVKLKCPAVGNPKPNVKWIKDGMDINKKGFVRFANPGRPYKLKLNNVLLIKSLQPSDQGNFTCIISNKYGSIRRTFELTGIQKNNAIPIIIQKPQNLTLIEGMDAHFTCKFDSSSMTQILWLKVKNVNSRNISRLEEGWMMDRKNFELVQFNGGENYTIKNVKQDNDGVYYCVARNAIGNAVDFVFLRVLAHNETIAEASENLTTIVGIEASEDVTTTIGMDAIAEAPENVTTTIRMDAVTEAPESVTTTIGMDAIVEAPENVTTTFGMEAPEHVTTTIGMEALENVTTTIRMEANLKLKKEVDKEPTSKGTHCFTLNASSKPYSSTNADPSSPSPSSCQVKCQQDPSCRWFNFGPAGVDYAGCWLIRTDKTGETTSQGWVTGPKYCGVNPRQRSVTPTIPRRWPMTPTSPDQVLNAAISSNKVMIISMSTCPYCIQAKNIFRRLGIQYQAMELDRRSDSAGLWAALGRKTGQNTVPRIFINGRYIGGLTNVQNLMARNQLWPMVRG